MSGKTVEQLEQELAEAQAKIDSLQARLKKVRDRAEAKDAQCKKLLVYMSACSGHMLQGHDWNALSLRIVSMLRGLEGGEEISPSSMRGLLQDLSLFMTSSRAGDASIGISLWSHVKPLSFFCRSDSPLLHGVSVTADPSLADVRVLYLADVMFPVLANLVRNAKIYGKVEGKPLAIHFAFEQIEGKDYLTLQDNGPGIPEGVTLFEPFSSTAPSGSLRGLGLYLCRELCRFHGRDLIYIPTEGGAKFGIEVKIESVRCEGGSDSCDA